ncbi:extracellular solute-binding protein [Paenibacillus radicis (ex Xue et al. 2023)]|uniref:Extracellular solute-binding protein n=1 Tax=Paenibacillus radicis (ex Xue et al. 2023) TaxID=2972489 RepID=A0ABT1YRM2_9BACL|nr:extracellular solute-binding protein [Paenibacillus radicis (ex Xue et al. 2023)]MCR8635823.1 extracellular solute-binding protein [Paenibacillus radicis (ex Xue et al. 2023)]
MKFSLQTGEQAKYRHKVRKGMMILLASTFGVSIALTGCSSKDAPAAGASDNAKSEDKGPTEISFLLKYYSAQPPTADEALKIIEQHTNTKLKINWAPNPSYEEKVNTTLASGNLPNVILVPRRGNTKLDNFVDAVRAGAFWELGPYIKDYPNLSKTISKEAFYNVAFDGKIYSIPSLRSNNESTIIVRKDWLDNLGLKIPTTLDEYYEMIKAFKNNDPDKNGKPDTVGLVESSDGSTFHRVKVWMDAPNNWGVIDGKVTPDFMTKEYVDAMNFMRKLYKEKLVNEDFAVVTQNQLIDYINKGKGGLYAGAFAQLTNGQYNPLTEADPKAKLTLFDRMKGPSGENRNPVGSGFNGEFMIPKSSVKTEAQLKKILSFFDKMCDDDMKKLVSLGIEGKHFKTDNGKTSVVDAKAFTNDIVPLRWIMVADGITDRVTAGLNPYDTEIAKVVTDKELKMVNDLSIPFTSKTVVDPKIIDDARTKYIMGELDEKGWSDAIQKWRSSNGDKLIKEYADQYAKIGK